ncbi:type I restriction enzyme specificity subunit [Helicobacter pylori CPY6261]|uniref:restriction endonuclease subunit S n=1 Tax=Helicobacter pylori TaxID=210 RepID=UPI00026AAB90|nr:restriction endonuclease subunit S [Helicobacter pylori]EJB21905.1 type I restriction enzyme specificity subunit [Helicobacter pylori CPY6261]WRB71674.1 restriction endonuclease subunit S [Helicobacter pylori]BDA06836.1 restriction endonuclease subunit S [Helicobacter pylori]
MSEWQTFCLKDLGKIVGGATPSTNNPKNYGNKIAWITPKDLSTLQGRYIKKGSRSISRLGFKSCSCVLLPKHAILFSSRAPIGYVAIAKKRLCTNQGFKSIIPNKKIYFEFLYYLLKYHKDNISNIGGGTTFKEVSGATLGLFKVKIPPTYYEQQKIARTLSILDQKIENNHKINELLHKILELLYEQYFVRFDFLDENNKPYQTSGGKMKFSKELNRLIPSGWSVRFLNHKIVSTYQPKTISKTLLNDSYSYSVYGGGGIIGRFTEYNHEQSEFIISCRGQCGISYLTLPKSWITGNAMVIRPTKSYTSKTYLYHTIKKYKLTNYITGSVQPQITRQNLSTMPILIPKRKTLNKWNNISSLLWNLIHNNMQSTQTLTALRDFLLPLLLKQQVKPE